MLKDLILVLQGKGKIDIIMNFRKIKKEELGIIFNESDAKWVTVEEFEGMINDKEIIPTIDFNEEDYKKCIALKQELYT